ncbi:hypothetical protein Clacol_003358 [Clathrus columnatus]|uniref:Uncharacterized protein n=1 Tax=Clathrus columnatus TaxID=1419009 RepID=A0AAV5A397_9AGAM|nr:hypothetical protein Clacol_003358 [Clathrus columnatus]
MLSSLPQDQSFYINTLNQRLIILSVSEEGFKIGKGTDYIDFTKPDYKNGVYLYTENLGTTSDISGAQGLTISTFSLQCAKDGVIINSNGAHGEDSKDGGGTNGAAAGVLSIFVQDLTDETAKGLNIQARGGNGGDTYSKSGSVGNGGKGGTINSVFQPTYVQLHPVFERCFNREEFHPKGTNEEVQEKYNAPVTIGDSIYDNAKTVISFSYLLSVKEETIKAIFQPLCDEITKIDNKETRTVLQVKKGLNNSRHNLNQFIANQQSEVVPMNSNVQGGFPGRGVNVVVKPGQPGDNGQQNQVFLRTWAAARNFTDASFPIAHPLHCSMLLDRANLFFYINSPSLRTYAKSLYQRIIDRLSFLPLKPEDLLFKAYSNCAIMSSTVIADLENIKTKASNLLVHLNAGNLDYNGFEALWVPRASYRFYSDVLDKALNDLTIFEDAYIRYHDALETGQNLNDKLSIAYNNTSSIISSLIADQQDLKSIIQDLNRNIHLETPVVEKARKELMEAYEAEMGAIKKSFGLNVPQMVNALTMIAFSPAKFMSGLQISDLIYQGFTSIPTIDGASVTKDYLASQFRQSEAAISNISTLLEKKINSTYELDDPFAARIIIEKEKILKQLNQFSQEAFGGVDDVETKKNLVKKFDALIGAVTKRNGFILDYNVSIKLLLSKTAEAMAYKEKEKELVKRHVELNDPDLPAITSYIGAIYQTSRSRVMKLINILLRSLNFRMVITSDVYNYTFQSDDPSNPTDLDKVPLSLTSTVLRNVRSSIEDKFNQQVEHWGSEPARFPNNFDIDEGKQFHLSKYELEQLLDDQEHTKFLRKVLVTIPEVDKYSTNAGDFEDCCNIRLYRIRFGLTGLRASTTDKKARVQFKLIHGGNETIFDRSNAAFQFKHEPVSTIFSFRVDDKGNRFVVDNGNVEESDAGRVVTSYAAPGPFTEWTISMKGTEWDSLDKSKVTDGYFDFCGTNYTFI